MDDSDIAISILDTLYPVGSLYIGSGNLAACPLAVLGVGTWVLKSANSIVTDIDGTVPVKGNGKTLGLTDGTNNFGLASYVNGSYAYVWNTAYDTQLGTTISAGANNVAPYPKGVTTDGSKSGLIADLSSTVTLSVKIWERTA